MRLTIEARHDMRRMVAVFGVSLAFIVVQRPHRLSPQADPDRDRIKDEVRNGEDDEDDKASPILDQQSPK
jgi:hypothetical protein